jgi:hypothetical protein
MKKEELLDIFEKFFTLNERDSGYISIYGMELAKNLYPGNKDIFIGMLKDWINESDKPSVQIFALSIIEDLKIIELLENVYNLRTEIERIRKMPYLKDDLEIVNKTISILESCN